MSAALGGYLKALREAQGLRPSEVLDQLRERLGTSIAESRLWRAEQGKAWPEGEFLTALLDILHASLEDVAWIQRSADATREDGIRRANERLIQNTQARMAEFATTDEGRLRLLRAVYALSDDPELRGRIQGYLDGLQSSPR